MAPEQLQIENRGHRFQPGNQYAKETGFKPGNRYGHAPEPGTIKRWATRELVAELNRLIADPADPKKKLKRIHLMIVRMVDNAIAGDMSAIKEIFDRVEGRVPQAVALNVNDQRDANSIRIDPADATDEELALIMEIAKRRKAPQLEAQITKTVEEADGATG